MSTQPALVLTTEDEGAQAPPVVHTRRTSEGLSLLERVLLVAFLAVSCGAYLYAYGFSPIFAGDTDVWYHLNSGRYFWTHGRPPSHNFFSFLRPERAWTDYFWLFQAFIYQLYAKTGYYGLIVYRALAFLAIQTALLLLLLSGRRERRVGLVWPTALFFLFGLVLSTRYFLIRPHTLSYLFLAIFLLVLERGRRWAWLLPALAVVWVNVHGITYPVLYVVCFSHLGELAWRRLRTGSLSKSDLAVAASLTGCLLTVYLTPHGTSLIRVPFVSTDYAAQYINELAPVQWRSFFSGEVVRLVPSSRTAFHLIVAATVCCCGSAAFRRQLALRHLLLVLGGAFLLTKGSRMTCEFSLLAAPLLALGPGKLGRQDFLTKYSAARFAGPAFVAILAAAQVFMVRDLGWTRWKYPFSPRNLPVGVTRFLATVGPGGRLLNDHNSAGYVQWSLYPRYSIFMDMEVPYLFTDDDMFLTVNVFKNPVVFGRLVEQYHPDFVTVPIANKDFAKIASKFDRYRPVFFDDAEVLYVDRERHPALAAAYELRELRPHELPGESLDELLEGWDEEEGLAELRRIFGVYPDCGLVNQVLAMHALRKKDYPAAARYAARVIHAFPEAPQGYKLSGDALQRRGLFREALDAYAEGMKRSEGSLPQKIHVEIGHCYRSLGDYEQAYRSFAKGVRPYSPDVTFKELYYLGSAAYLTGRVSEAERLYRFALSKAPASEQEWAKRLQAHVALFDSPPAEPARP